MLFDSHAHLDDPRFDEDRDLVIESLPDKGISYCINAGADMASSKRSVALAQQYAIIYASVGIHPHDAKNAEIHYLQSLQELAKHPKVVAIGEIGLDYHYDLSPREIQRQILIEQLALAERLVLPVILHDREAHGDLLAILKERPERERPGVLHCFSGSWEMAKICLSLGYYIGIGGSVTFKNAVKTVEVAQKVPLDRLLIETDSPYLAPHPHRGKRNDPSLVRHVAEKISEIRAISLEETAAATLSNAVDFFGLSLR